MAKIFVRERRKVEQGEKKARFRVVGVSGKELKLYADHIRKSELETIAKESGAQIIYMTKHGSGNRNGKM